MLGITLTNKTCDGTEASLNMVPAIGLWAATAKKVTGTMFGVVLGWGCWWLKAAMWMKPILG